MRTHSLTIPPLLILAGVFVIGCSQLQLSGTLPRAASTSGLPEPPLDVAWTQDVGGACGSDALQVHEGALVVGTRNGNVSVIEIETGRVLGKGDFGGAVEGAVGIADPSTLIIPVSNERVGVVSHGLRSGNRNWTLEGGPHPAGVLVMEDQVITVGYDGTIRVVDPSTGGIAWQRRPDSTASFRTAPLAIDGEQFVVANDHGNIAVYHVGNDRPRWSKSAEGPVVRSPALMQDLLLVPTTRGALSAFNVSTGDERWTINRGPDVRFASPLVAQNRMYVGTSAGEFFAADPSGNILWSYSFDGVIDARPVQAAEYVYVPTMDRSLHVLDTSDGSHVWTTELPGRIKTNLVITGDLLLACREPHHVVAFRSRTMEEEE